MSEGVVLLTVHKKEEVDFIYSEMQGIGIDGEIIDNRDDTSIYDQWVYIGVKESTAPDAPS
jgi:hypothetical protein